MRPGQIVKLVLALSVIAAFVMNATILCGQGEDSTKGPQGTEAVHKVGGEVTSPRPIYSPEPDYPKKMRNGLKDGTVILALVVWSDGLPRDIAVVRSLSPGFDEEAINAVKKWKFKPATKDSKPVAVKINVEVTFRLY
jgi:periplasmic protein TonB